MIERITEYVYAQRNVFMDDVEAALKSPLLQDVYLQKGEVILQSPLLVQKECLQKVEGRENDNDETNYANEGSASKVASNIGTPSSRESADLTKDMWRLCFGAAGIYVAFLYQGSVQEDLFRYRDATGKSFDFVWYLQFLESAASIVIGIVGCYICGSSQTASFGTISPFLMPGASQLFSKAFTHLSLAGGLSFPIVVVAKSGKIVPVMLGQLLLGESMFGWRDFLFAALVVSGTVLLSLGGDNTVTSNSTFTGLLLVVLSLATDGVTAGLQKRHKTSSASNPPTAYDFVLFSNLSMIVISAAIAMALNEFKEGYEFLSKNPVIGSLVLQCCVCSAVGQIFIYYIIERFDPLTCSTITTTRKLLSVLLSIFFKGHQLNDRGIAGLGLAMAGLAVEIDNKVSHHKQSQLKDVRDKHIDTIHRVPKEQTTLQ